MPSTTVYPTLLSTTYVSPVYMCARKCKYYVYTFFYVGLFIPNFFF